jgi:hypothetical protein
MFDGQHGFALQFASPELQADKEVFIAAVKHLSFQLSFASPDLRVDNEVVMFAVQNGSALQFASPELQADKEVVMASVHANPDTIQFASAELQRDEDVIRVSLGREYVETGYNNIHMAPVVGDYVTLVLRVSQSNPVVHRVSVLLPDGRVQLNDNIISAIYVRSLNFVPNGMVIKDRELGLRLRDRSFTMTRRGGKRRRKKTRNIKK